MFFHFISILLLLVCAVCSSDELKCPKGTQLFQHAGGYRECLTCSDCQRGLVKVKNCSLESDAICESCDAHSYYHDEEPHCRSCSGCPPGEFMKNNCSKFLDSECEPCLIGTFSSHTNSSSCTKCNKCTKGYISECNSAQNSICKTTGIQSNAVKIKVVIPTVLGVVGAVGVIVAVIIWYKRKNGATKQNQEEPNDEENHLLENSSFKITDEDITEDRQMALLAIHGEGSKQVEAIKKEGEKQKESVVSSVIQAEKRALDEVALETGRQRKVIKAKVDVYRRDAVENIQDKGNQQVETLNVVGEKQSQKVQNEGSDQVRAGMDEGEKQRHPVVQAINVAGERQIENIQQAAKTQTDARYQEEKNKLKCRLIETYIAQLQPATLPEVNRLYVEPCIELVTDDTGGGKGNTDTDIDMLEQDRGTNINNVFFQDEKQFKRIYISGDAGHGKTALCNMLVLAWCQEHSGNKINEYIPTDFLTVMKKFDFLFYIALRNIKNDWIISEIIKKQYFNDLDFLNMFMKNECDKSSCLLILDGLDEWTLPDAYETPMLTTNGLPDLRHFERFTILTTTRPWKLKVLRLGPLEMDRQVQLKGIDRNASDIYIYDMVDLLNKKKNVERYGENLTQQLKDKDLKHFLNNPILLKQLIMLWHHDEKAVTGSSQVHLYSAMINHLLKDAWERNKKMSLSVGKTQESELPLCLKQKHYCKIHKRLLLSLAHLAFTATLKEQLVFDHVEAELENLSEDDVKSCLTAGLLCQEIYTSPHDDAKKKLSFLHKTFQDFLAAVFLVMNPDSAVLPETCNTVWKICDMHSLFIFVSGMDSKIMTSLSHQIWNIMMNDEEVKKYISQQNGEEEDCISHMRLIQDLLCECAREGKESGQPLLYCHLEAVVIDNYLLRHTDWETLQLLTSSNMSHIKYGYVDIFDYPDENIFNCLIRIVSECQCMSLALKWNLSQDKEDQLYKALYDNRSLSSLKLKESICEPFYRYLYSDNVTTLDVLTIIDVEFKSHTDCQRFMTGVGRATQLKTLKLNLNDDYNYDREFSDLKEIHLDLSHCSQLQKLSLEMCGFIQVTVNTALLTHFQAYKTFSCFVTSPHVHANIETRDSGGIKDPHSLNKIVSILPTGRVEKFSCHLDLSQCSQLQKLNLQDCDFTKVTINTSSLTDCKVQGTPVYFVPHPHVQTSIRTLELKNISDPHSLDEIVTILPYLTQLSRLVLHCLDFGDRCACLSPKSTNLKTVKLYRVVMTDKAMIQFLDSVVNINLKVACLVEDRLNEAVETHITSRFVVTGRDLDGLHFHSQPTASPDKKSS